MQTEPEIPHDRRAFELQDHVPDRLNDYAFVYYRRLERVQRYVECHYMEPVSLKAAADVAGLERTYFSKFFRRTAGIPFSHWLHWLRVTRAVSLMRSTDATITDVAQSVGYSDLRTFERAVKRCTGLSPRRLKKLLAPAIARLALTLSFVECLEPVALYLV